MSFESKVAIVTGAGSGIGEASAKELARRGATVVVADVDKAGGERVAEEIRAAGGTASFTFADVSDEQSAENLIASTVAAYGGLHLAVNNAGLGQMPGPLHELDTATWRRVLGVDLDGTFYCMRAELRHMVEHGGGAIVNMASGTGLKAAPGMNAYVAAKHGVVGLTRTAGLDYAQRGVRVNAVAPGTISTPQMRSFPAEQQAIWSRVIPMGRMGTPEEIAGAVAYLLSDEAGFVTGTVLEIDGGYMQSSAG